MGCGGGVDGQIEAAGELHATQNAQRVFGKGFAGGAKDVVVQIYLAAEEVPDFAGEGIEAHGVDGEIAAGGGFARGDGGVEVGGEIAVAGTGFAVAAGDAKVTRYTWVNPGLSKLHHAEALADQVDAAAGGDRNAGQFIVRDSVDFTISMSAWAHVA